jgi:hypothetical protein
MDSGHRQLVGTSCIHCQTSLASVLDGKFCPRCSCPVHHECAVPNSPDPALCPQCGADAQSQALNRELAAKAVAQVRREEKGRAVNLALSIVVRTVAAGVCLLVAVVFFFLSALPLSGVVFEIAAVGLLVLALTLIGSLFYRRLPNGRFVSTDYHEDT